MHTAVNFQVHTSARKLYGTVMKKPSQLRHAACMKGKQDLPSVIGLEQADYRSLVISLDTCFVLNLAVLPPEELKKSSQLLLTIHRGLPLTSHSVFLLSRKMLFV